MAAVSPRRIVRLLVLVLTGLYLLLPLLAMVEFSTRGAGGARTGEAWQAIGTDDDLVASILTSVELALLTVGGMLLLLVPTMTWVHLRVPRMRRVIEFICLLPHTDGEGAAGCRRRRRLLAAAAGVVLVALGSLLAWSLGGDGGGEDLATNAD